MIVAKKSSTQLLASAFTQAFMLGTRMFFINFLASFLANLIYKQILLRLIFNFNKTNHNAFVGSSF